MGKVLGRELVTATPQARGDDGAGMVTWMPTTPVVSFYASVQPVGQWQIDLLPELSRESAKWILYPEGVPALVEGTRYRIVCSKGTLMPVGFVDLSVHASGLSHLAPVCMEVEADE